MHSRRYWRRNAFCISSLCEYEGQGDVMCARYAMLVSLRTVSICSPYRRSSSRLLPSRLSKMSPSRQTVVVSFYKNCIYYELHKTLYNRHGYKSRYTKKMCSWRVGQCRICCSPADAAERHPRLPAKRIHLPCGGVRRPRGRKNPYLPGVSGCCFLISSSRHNEGDFCEVR